ncbi:hypothetical protein ACFE33_08555 [Falsihalocynthiibacter sp. SS001]|uniref:hypothetical protein n=1 Tax=Falsihalocynthiibacter sp. SS001 TaxID=3349698 RepID=UPI0036D26100
MRLSPRHFLRMSMMARRPASSKRVKFVFGVILICAVLYGIERWIGWPESMSLERPAKIKVKD